ncbi:1-phosphofructokinase [Aeribacillus sp. FSL K6-1305]|uniref:1-phosphofructokinase n=1 Tax=Aeribacillus sp. FSL K6-1305 TaxID=2954569 RepID=UPI0030FDE176
MIYTVTLNPSIDYHVRINHLKIGELNRAEETLYFPGGKGINVSRVLKRLGIDSVVLGFAGGFTGDFLKNALISENIAIDFTEVEEPTRINIKLKGDQETEINGNGPAISKEKQEKLLSKISSLNKNDVLVLAGSLPPTVPENFYETIASICQEREIPFVVDTSGPSLKRLIPMRPFLIKPNHHELGELFHVNIETIEDAIKYGKKLQNEGARNVIVTMGGNGAVLINTDHTVLAKVPKGNVKNTVGAGDSTVAGFLASYFQNHDAIKAFQHGVSAGSATAFSEDLCTKESVEQLLPNIRLEIYR